MKYLYLTILIALTQLTTLCSQTNWLYTQDLAIGETGERIMTDDDGNVYLLTEHTNGYPSWYNQLKKFDAAHNIVWSQQIHEGVSITSAFLHNDSIFLYGHYQGGISPDIGIGESGEPSAALVRIFTTDGTDAGGFFIANGGMGGWDRASFIEADGYYYFASDYRDHFVWKHDTLDLTPGPNLMVLKCRPDLSVVWQKHFSHSHSNYQIDLHVTGDQLVIAGDYSDSLNFGGATVYSQTMHALYIAALDTAGNYRWLHHFGCLNSGDNDMLCSTADDSGNIYVTAMSTSAAEFDGAPPFLNPGTMNYYLVKFDANGNRAWIQGNRHYDQEITAQQGSLYKFVQDSLVAFERYDLAGNLLNQYYKTWIRVADIKVKPDDSFLMTGYYTYNSSFGTPVNLTACNAYCNSADVFLSAEGSSSLGTGVADSAGAHLIRVFPNPSAGQFRLEGQDLNDAKVLVRDILGNTVWERPAAHEALIDINLQEKPKGIYCAEIYSKGSKQVLKLVLQ